MDNTEEVLHAIVDAVRDGHMTAEEAIAFVEANPTKDAAMRIVLLDILEVLNDIDRLDHASGRR
jgi:hypothetical protein